MIARLGEYLAQIKRDYRERIQLRGDVDGDVATAIGGRFLTEIAAKILWVRNQSARVETLLATAEPTLADLTSFRGIAALARPLLAELKAAEAEQFEKW